MERRNLCTGEEKVRRSQVSPRSTRDCQQKEGDPKIKGHRRNGPGDKKDSKFWALTPSSVGEGYFTAAHWAKRVKKKGERKGNEQNRTRRVKHLT